jgi:hypothetical protein
MAPAAHLTRKVQTHMSMVISVPSWVLPCVFMLVVPVIYQTCGGNDNDRLGIGVMVGTAAAAFYALLVWVVYFGIMHVFY